LNGYDVSGGARNARCTLAAGRALRTDVIFFLVTILLSL